MNQAVHGLIKLKVPLPATKVHGAWSWAVHTKRRAELERRHHTRANRAWVCVRGCVHCGGWKCVRVLSNGVNHWISSDFHFITTFVYGLHSEVKHFADLSSPFKTNAAWRGLFRCIKPTVACSRRAAVERLWSSTITWRFCGDGFGCSRPLPLGAWLITICWFSSSSPSSYCKQKWQKKENT